MKILWIGTSYYPAPGGAATYCRLIGEQFDRMDAIQQTVLLVEAFPGQPEVTKGPSGRFEVRRVFPFRGGSDKKDTSVYARYALQNLVLLKVPALARRMHADIAIIHSWHFIHPSVISLVARRLRNQGVKLVADMRDTFLPPHHFQRLNDFGALICCGLRVTAHFAADSRLSGKLHHLPVPVEATDASASQTKETLRQFDLVEDGYIFAPVGVHRDKRFPLLYDAWRRLLDQGGQYDLVVAGRNRDWEGRFARQHSNGRLILAGALAKEPLHGLYKAAALSINPSNFESLGRVPVEAIQYGKPLIFASGVPEFDGFPSDYICTTDDPAVLATQMMRVINKKELGVSFDLSQHAPAVIAQRMYCLFADLLCRPDTTMGTGYPV